MNFHKGDLVIHWAYGLGEIVQIDEKIMPGQARLYYVVRTRDLTVWVPADDKVATRLRLPTPEGEFKKLIAILRSPSEMLPNDRFERKTHLVSERKGGSAEANCRVVRDLSSLQERKELNEHDKLILKQALDTLLDEWTYSLSVPLAQAKIEVGRLLSQHQQQAAAG